MLPTAQIANIELLSTGSTGSEESDWLFFYWFFQSPFQFCGVKLDSVSKPSERMLSQKTDRK